MASDMYGDEPEGEDAKTSRRSQRDGKVLAKLISRAEQVKKKRFDRIGKEIVSYGYGDGYDKPEDYQTWDTSENFGAKVAKTHVAIQTFGPYLYQTNPKREVSIMETASDISLTRAEMMEDYLNWAIGEYQYEDESKGAVDDSIAWGMGVVWHGISRDKENLVVSVHDSITNFLADGDAESWAKVNWVGRKRREPKWKLYNRFPEARSKIERMAAVASHDDAGESGSASSTDMLEYYELYLRVGLHNYCDHVDEDERDDEGNVNDEPKKYCVTRDGTILSVTDWEIPYYLDGDWPCTPLYFIQKPGSVWPVSPLESGMGWQRAINWCATALIARYHWGSRNIIAILTANGIELSEDEKDAIANGTDPVEVIELKANGIIADENINIGQFVQQIRLSGGEEEALRVLEYLEQQYAEATGLNEILKSGVADSQFRNAEAARLASEASKNRISNMIQRVEAWESRKARKEALAARILLTPEDLRPLFGQDAKLWGDLLTTEEMDPAAWYAKYVGEGYTPDLAMELAQDAVQNALTIDDWRMETDYSIEQGSTRRKSPEEQDAVFENLLNQTVPVFMQDPDPSVQAAGLAITGAYLKHKRLDPEAASIVQSVIQRKQMQAMAPPPMPAPAGAPPMAPQEGPPLQ